jgi:RimJ/RimL family protein N-acetyltransferase
LNKNHRLPEVQLLPFTPADYQRLIAWIDTPEAMSGWSAGFFSFPLTEEQLGKYAAEAAEGKRAIFSVYDESRHVGHVELSHHLPYHSAFLSRILAAPDVRGQGYGEAMVRKLVTYAFEEQELHFVNLGVVRENERAIALYSKLSFETIGERSAEINTPAGPITVIWMMLKRSTWQS